VAVALLAGVYLIRALAVMIGAAGLADTLPQLVTHDETRNLTPGLIPGFVIAPFILWFAIFVLRPRVDDTPGWIEVSREEAPELWYFVDQVARDAGTRTPARLRLTTQANASVREDGRLLGLIPGQRTMSIGLPLLAALSANEIRAILFHEFGHYARGHTRLGPLVYRGAVQLDDVNWLFRRDAGIDNLSADVVTRLVWHVLSSYRDLYFRVTLQVRRKQELEADAEAARRTGATIFSSALRAVYAAEAAWAEFQENCFRPLLMAGLVPADPFRAFAAMLNDSVYRARWEDLKRFPPPLRESAYDSHPPLKTRLERLEQPRPAASEAPRTSRLELPRSPDAWTIALTWALLFPMGQPPARLPNEEWLVRLVDIQTEETEQRLLTAAGHLTDDGAPTVDTVLGMLAAGRGAELAARFGALQVEQRPLIVKDATAGLEDALHTLVGRILVAKGQASWRPGWTQPARLAAGSIPDEELRDLVSSAIRHPDTVGRLGAFLTEPRQAEAALASVAGTTPARLAVLEAPTAQPGTKDTSALPTVIGVLAFLLLATAGALAGRYVAHRPWFNILVIVVELLFGVAAIVFWQARRRGQAREAADDTSRPKSIRGIGRYPEEIGLSRDGRTAYVAAEKGTLAVVDLRRRVVSSVVRVGRRAVNVLVVSDELVFVSVLSFRRSRLVVVNPRAGRVVTTVKEIGLPRGLAASLDGDAIYVVGMKDNRLWRLDPTTYEITGSATVGKRPCDVVRSPDGRLLYVSNDLSQSISFVEARTLTQVAVVESVPRPRSLAVSPDGSRLYVVCLDGTLAVINTASRGVMAFTRPSRFAGTVAVDGTGDRVYVTEGTDSSLIVCDRHGRTIGRESVHFGDRSPVNVVVGPDNLVHIISQKDFLDTLPITAG